MSGPSVQPCLLVSSPAKLLIHEVYSPEPLVHLLSFMIDFSKTFLVVPEVYESDSMTLAYNHKNYI